MLLVVTVANLRNIAILTAPGVEMSDIDQAFNVAQPVGTHLSLGICPWGPLTITGLVASADPGSEGARRAALQGADSALFVISAEHGIDSATIAWWADCSATQMPRSILITDVSVGDYDEALAICQRVFEGDVLALQYPLLDDHDRVAGIIDVLAMTIDDYSEAQRQIRASDPEHRALLVDARQRFLDALSAESEAMLTATLANQEADPAHVQAALRDAVCHGVLAPVLIFEHHGDQLIGWERLLDFIGNTLPSPDDRAIPPVSTPDGDPCAPLQPKPDDPLCAAVLCRSQGPDQVVENIVRVFSGTLRAGTTIVTAGVDGVASDDVDGVKAVGDEARTASAGTIAVVTGLPKSRVGNTLSDPQAPRLLSPWPLPLALYPVSIEAPGIEPADVDDALDQCRAADPVVRLADGALWCVDRAHAHHVERQLRELLGSEGIALRESHIGLRETVSQETRFEADECFVTVTPAPRGAGLTTIPGDLAALIGPITGVAPGAPLTDVIIEVTPHTTDTAQIQRCIAQALAEVGTHVLEPVGEVQIQTPTEFVQAIQADLNRRRATQITATPNDPARTTVTALAPMSALVRYPVDLHTLTSGTAHVEIRQRGYETQPRMSSTYRRQ